MKTKDFPISELFDVSATKSIDKRNIKNLSNGQYDYVGRASENRGIQGHPGHLGFDPYPANTFSVVQIGEVKAVWRENEWYASQNIFMLRPLTNKIVDCFLYIEGAINKCLSKYSGGYISYPTKKSLSNDKISLPVTTVIIPDWAGLEVILTAYAGGGRLPI